MAAVPERSLIPSFEEARHVVEEHASHLPPRSKELLKLLDSDEKVVSHPAAAFASQLVINSRAA